MQLATRVPFEPGSSQLGEEAIHPLAELAQILRREPHIERVVAVGLAAPDEPEPDALSLARAEIVRTFLAAHGVDPARLDAKGFGASDPLPSAAPWPSTPMPTNVYFIVMRSEGRERFVLEDHHYIARDTTPLGPRPEPPSVSLCPEAAR